MLGLTRAELWMMISRNHAEKNVGAGKMCWSTRLFGVNFKDMTNLETTLFQKMPSFQWFVYFASLAHESKTYWWTTSILGGPYSLEGPWTPKHSSNKTWYSVLYFLICVTGKFGSYIWCVPNNKMHILEDKQNPWKMMAGKYPFLWGGHCSGAMLQFEGVPHDFEETR